MSDVKGKSTSDRGLTPKQEKFCQLYIELGNASEAYRQSYNCSKMTTKTVNEEAARLLNNPKITARVEGLQQAHRQRHNLTVDNIIADLQELRDICMGRKSVVLTDVVKNAQEGSVNAVDSPVFVFEPTSANKALELLGKHLGMFANKVDVTTDGKPLPTVINVTFSDEPA
ncbi:terminase small subunit [Haemophilus haemolyticus]|uniref:Terminase small subunit n=1 Tax=Haemophilus haemolyticus TaxID=726 RepID=A0A502LGB8_HAEHA|nr:terminase small subunit [Haemophilus haemolyticus]TPH22906.1 terminase small subunit [Haemophilus haemolyticus]